MTERSVNFPAISMLPHPIQLEILDFSAYALIIDARSPHEYQEDHLPGATNLPVVDDEEFAEVGIKHRTDKHSAYLIGVEYSLQNIARHMRSVLGQYKADDRMLVYCFRGGKRSKLWGDALRTVGFQVDVLRGGWKAYRRWVNESLALLPPQLSFRVLGGATGAGKTRLLKALAAIGEQTLDLEGIAAHRGSLIGGLPDVKQPTQKLFDSALLTELRRFDPERPVWIEAESKKIGNVQIPESLHTAIRVSPRINVTSPMPSRVALWREDYPHLAADPVKMVEQLVPLKPLVGGAELDEWFKLAREGSVDALFERVMVKHYDPCYARSSRHDSAEAMTRQEFHLDSLASGDLVEAAHRLKALVSASA